MRVQDHAPSLLQRLQLQHLDEGHDAGVEGVAGQEEGVEKEDNRLLEYRVRFFLGAQYWVYAHFVSVLGKIKSSIISQSHKYKHSFGCRDVSTYRWLGVQMISSQLVQHCLLFFRGRHQQHLWSYEGEPSLPAISLVPITSK